ncbi:hypothetical protein M9458_036899, partial [Cirrhinus mrigala]
MYSYCSIDHTSRERDTISNHCSADHTISNQCSADHTIYNHCSADNTISNYYNIDHAISDHTISNHYTTECTSSLLRKGSCGACDQKKMPSLQRNLKKHIDRKHTEEPIQDINATFHLESQCIDRTNGIFTVLKVIKGHSVPLHIQLKTWGEHHKVICESHECQVNMEVAQRSGLSSYQCKHIRSVNYCTSSAEPVSLKEEILSEM